MLCLNETKTNMKLYIFGFTCFSVSFTLWQKVFLRKWFWPFAFVSGVFAGTAFAMIRSGWFITEKLDALGKDYETSRLVKQDIFDTRPDLNASMRAQYYIY